MNKDDMVKVRIPCPDGRAGCGVCHYAWLPKDAYNQIHDRYYDAYNRRPSDSIIGQIYKSLPSEITSLANEWGWSDTEVREKLQAWYSERIIVTFD